MKMMISRLSKLWQQEKPTAERMTSFPLLDQQNKNLLPLKGTWYCWRSKVKFENMLMLDNDDDVKDEDIELVDIIVSKKGNSNWDRNNMKLE